MNIYNKKRVLVYIIKQNLSQKKNKKMKKKYLKASINKPKIL